MCFWESVFSDSEQMPPFLTDCGVAMETSDSINVAFSNRQEYAIGVCVCV